MSLYSIGKVTGIFSALLTISAATPVFAGASCEDLWKARAQYEQMLTNGGKKAAASWEEIVYTGASICDQQFAAGVQQGRAIGGAIAGIAAGAIGAARSHGGGVYQGRSGYSHHHHTGGSPVRTLPCGGPCSRQLEIGGNHRASGY